MQLTSEQNHLVQFYNSEDFLCERVADFLAGGLSSGEPIVIIASEDRHQAFSRRLQDKGFEVEPARARGQFTWLDAHQTLAQFMVGTMPDWDLFKSVVGNTLERSSAVGGHPRIRAYGEMVDILWRAGNPRAAIRLEEMWNELAKSHSFQLLCAYVMGSFYKSHQGGSIQDVCGLHTAVLPVDDPDDQPEAESAVGEEAVQALVAEIGHRQQVEEALRQSLRELRQSEERERSSSMRIARLQQATSSLATALTVGDVTDTIIGLSKTVLGAAASVVYLLDEESGTFQLAGSRGIAAATAERWPTLPLNAPLPLSTAIRRREPIWFETYDELVRAYPQVAPSATPASNMQAGAALPLVHAGRLLGGFVLGFEEHRIFAEEDRQWLTSFAAQGALAVDRARLYEAEKRAVQQLTDTVRMNELFAGVLAHDLRNPLGAILTAAQLALLRDQRGDSDKLEAPLSRIVSSGRRMARMVDQLLDLSRVRLGAGMQLQPKPLDLSGLLRQVIDELKDGNPQAPLGLEALGDHRGSWDGDRLFQVFSNLVGNAMQHGRAEHGVRVRLDGTGPDSVRVDVHNQGVVQSELVTRLFEPLVGGERTSDRSPGLGLGLFIASQIVKAHGGQITFESSEAAGTTFSVRLPRVAVLGKPPTWMRQG
jgi:signal transduction histidine kinase